MKLLKSIVKSKRLLVAVSGLVAPGVGLMSTTAALKMTAILTVITKIIDVLNEEFLTDEPK